MKDQFILQLLIYIHSEYKKLLADQADVPAIAWFKFSISSLSVRCKRETKQNGDALSNPKK